MSTERARLLIVSPAADAPGWLGDVFPADRYHLEVRPSAHELPSEVVRRGIDLVFIDAPQDATCTACWLVKHEPATRLVPVIVLLTAGSVATRLQCLEAGADEVVMPGLAANELRARVDNLVHIKRYTDGLDSAESVVLSLSLTIAARDAYTEGHCYRMAEYAVALGQRLSLPELALQSLYWGSIVHDVGKIGIPDAILLKPGPLTPDEFAVMRQHTVIGEALCTKLRCLRHVAPILRYHHERLDGSGYPDGLRNEQIPLLAQIVGIVDVFDALTTDRPYRRAFSRSHASAHLVNEAALGWRRPDLVDGFLSVVRTNEASAVL
jgi:putative two-component system response regulator